MITITSQLKLCKFYTEYFIKIGNKTNGNNCTIHGMAIPRAGSLVYSTATEI